MTDFLKKMAYAICETARTIVGMVVGGMIALTLYFLSIGEMSSNEFYFTMIILSIILVIANYIFYDKKKDK